MGKVANIKEFEVKIRVTGKPLTIKKENIFMAFKKSDYFNLILKGKNMDVCANDFAIQFSKNFIFKVEEPISKISIIIRNEFHEWDQSLEN